MLPSTIRRILAKSKLEAVVQTDTTSLTKPITPVGPPAFFSRILDLTYAGNVHLVSTNDVALPYVIAHHQVPRV